MEFTGLQVTLLSIYWWTPGILSSDSVQLEPEGGAEDGQYCKSLWITFST